MTSYTYTGDPGRYYPALALTAQPGDTTDLPVDPGDGRWTPAAPTAAAPPAADPAPATAKPAQKGVSAGA
ncbi:hypothetical protein ACFC1T_02215 [Kitasatospora sp. NPDC056076]|uniref:hypothetical protein n=1 Tax=Kitasatospora sp. NPDC056076 TaxID=3345703 RepID=UPI0035E361EF